MGLKLKWRIQTVRDELQTVVIAGIEKQGCPGSPGRAPDHNRRVKDAFVVQVRSVLRPGG